MYKQDAWGCDSVTHSAHWYSSGVLGITSSLHKATVGTPGHGHRNATVPRQASSPSLSRPVICLLWLGSVILQDLRPFLELMRQLNSASLQSWLGGGPLLSLWLSNSLLVLWVTYFHRVPQKTMTQSINISASSFKVILQNPWTLSGLSLLPAVRACSFLILVSHSAVSKQQLMRR